MTAPAPPPGLSDDEVARRIDEGRVNRAAGSTSRSLWAIVRANVMAGLFVLLLLVPWSRHFFALSMATAWITISAIGTAGVAALLLEIGWDWTGWKRPDVPEDPIDADASRSSAPGRPRRPL